MLNFFLQFEFLNFKYNGCAMTQCENEIPAKSVGFLSLDTVEHHAETAH